MWTYLLAVAVVAITALVWYRKRRLSVFKRMGILGPEPNIFLGNMIETEPQGLGKTMQMWTEKYGKTYGYYEGPLPIIVTSDLDFLKQVYIKNFSCFHGRKYFPMMDDPEKGDCEMHLFLSEGPRWKRQRTFIAPTFSSAKMKQLALIINKAVDALMKDLEEKRIGNKPFDIYKCFQNLTLDAIATCGFGLDTINERGLQEQFSLQCKKVFEVFHTTTPLILLSLIFPELSRFWFALKFYIPKIEEDPMAWLKKRAAQIIDNRKQTRESADAAVDLVQLLINAQETFDGSTPSSLAASGVDEDEVTKPSAGEGFTRRLSKLAGKLSSEINWAEKTKLTKDEITSNAALFFFAGFETTSTALAYTVYELVQHPEEQEKIFEELSQVLKENDIAYDDMMNLKYLDMAFSEVLRMHPIAPSVIARRCMQDCTINGLKIAKGTSVTPDVFSIHYDQDIWGPPDTKEFFPERFSPEAKLLRNPIAYLPFGAGPRNCVGMRFALMEAKIALAKIIRRYKIIKCDEMQIPLKTVERGTIAPVGGIPVRLERRT